MIHAITATWAFDEAKKREMSARRCPKCDGEQSASKEQKSEAIICEKCDAAVSPDDTGKERALKDRTTN